MSFDSGSISFRIFHLNHDFDSELVSQLAKHAVPPVETLNTEPLTGWVTDRHLLDRNLTEEKCLHGGYVTANLLRAEKKIPESLLRAHCRLEEEAELKARDAEMLPRSLRAEIKERVRDELLPTMPPTLTGMPVCVDLRNQLLFAQALSDAKIDFLVAYFRETTGVTPQLLTPDGAALRRTGTNVNDLPVTSFSSDDSLEPEHEISIGMDFLTWLWFTWESDGGNLTHDGTRYGFMLEGPLTFFREGQGAHEAVLRNGSPLNSREAFAALHCGKKLRRGKFLMAEADNLWSCTIDSTFAFRSLKLPKTEQADPAGRLQERMIFLERFLDIFFTLYDRFLECRKDPRQWKQTLARVHAWIDAHLE